MKYVNSLTGLRGIAALIVFVSHCANEGMIPLVFGRGYGQIGVMLFFILSGFLMAHLYLRKDTSLQAIQQYLIARIARIFPLYIVAILLSVLISTTFYPAFRYNITEWHIVVRALLFIDAPYEFWTIPVEVQFYGVFVVFWVLYQRKTNPILLALFALATVIPSIFLFQKLGYMPSIFSSYSFPFFLGIVTAIFYPRITQSQSLVKLASYCALPCLIILFLNLPGFRLEHDWVFSRDFFLRTWADPINWLVVYSVFLCAMLNARGLGLLNTRPLVFLGEISFGFYLIHYPLLKIVKDFGVPVSLQFIVSFVLICIAAWLSYRFLEKPANRRIRSSVT